MNLVSKNAHIFSVNFSFAFAGKPLFFKNIECHFVANELNFVVGRNGIGKSTFLRILQGKINAGERIKGTLNLEGAIYNFADKSTQLLLEEHSRRVSQNYNNMLALNFLVMQNLSAAILPRFPYLTNKFSSDFIYIDMLQELGIHLDQPVSELSGGQRQILAIVMALQKPIEFLLLDEPTAALDEPNAHMVMKFLKKLAKIHKITIICISHDQELMKKYVRNIYYEIIKNNENTRYIKQKNFNDV